MAVEKLTGPRLFQLIFLLIVLISAFIWRTITYNQNIDSSINTQKEGICDITNKKCIFNLDGKQIIIDVKDRPIMQQSELNLLTEGLDSTWAVEAKGINMNMGILKFHNETKEPAIFSTYLPKCKHKEMKWNITLLNGNKSFNVILNSVK